MPQVSGAAADVSIAPNFCGTDVLSQASCTFGEVAAADGAEERSFTVKAKLESNAAANTLWTEWTILSPMENAD